MGQVCQLTSGGEEYLDGGVLEQIPSGEDGPDLGEVPLSVQVVAVSENLQEEINKNGQFSVRTNESGKTPRDGFEILRPTRRAVKMNLFEGGNGGVPTTG